MLTFAEYSENPAGNNMTDLVESILLKEITISPSIAKAAALGNAMKISQLNRTLAHSNASADAKTISSELYLLASLVAISVGTITDATRGRS